MQSLIDAILQFVPLTKSDILIIEQLFKEKIIKKGELFLKEGSVCNYLGFLEKGILRHFVNNDGEDITYNFSIENDFVCDYGSFINRQPSPKNIIALEPVFLFCISFENLQIFYEKIDKGERFGRLFLEKTFSEAIRHIISMHTDTAEQRYLNFLSSFPQLQQRIPQYYIASFIGVKPQSLSRIRKKICSR